MGVTMRALKAHVRGGRLVLDDQDGGAHWCAPTLAADAAALPPEGEQFAPWGGPAALMPVLRYRCE